MEKALKMPLSIEAKWERLDAGSPEERACFAALGIHVGNEWITRAEDAFVGRVREMVFLSAYRLAEWFAWNWWRLRWEPPVSRPNWPLAHRMSTIGGGYVWPNVTIASDWERVVLSAKPTRQTPTESLSYISDTVAAVSATEFEGAVDLFIGKILEQLRVKNIINTNLEHIWTEVLEERADLQRAEYRQLEALLGFDPDEASSDKIASLTVDGQSLGRYAVMELAATCRNATVATAVRLHEIAKTSGFKMCPKDVVQLSSASQLPPVGHVPAWRRGVQAARNLRAQEQLDAPKLSNTRLGQLAGVSGQVLTDTKAECDLSFALDDETANGHVVFRSKWETGRRFALARLLGDRIANANGDRLFPATNASTYRQKFQRAFAAELLCPFDCLQDRLGKDYSDESIDDVSRQFNVSPLTVRTQLVNHRVMDRESIAGDPEPQPPVAASAHSIPQ